MVLTVLTLLGLLHGLMLLPVLLSILGPPPEVTIPSPCFQPRGWGGTGKGRDRARTKSHWPKDRAQFTRTLPLRSTEGGSLSLCPNTMPLSLNFPGFFMGPTLVFRVKSNMHAEFVPGLDILSLVSSYLLLEANKGHNFPTIRVMHQ